MEKMKARGAIVRRKKSTCCATSWEIELNIQLAEKKTGLP
jgi:hypothetical protein